ncbi:Exonuclease SbcC [Methanocaldococcus lauensis]|nr:Exonuclease SbcC [Methanocaldococcus lauensis]
MNQNGYPTLVEIKNNKEKMIEKGEEMLKELTNIRILLEKLRKDEEENLDEITELEEKENYLATEILKLDLGIKILEVIEFIIENNIFRDYWKIIEEKIPYDELLEIVAEKGLNVKKVCMELYNIANIDDKDILNKIQNLPDDECQKVSENTYMQINKYLDKIISRIKKLKELTNNST